MANRYHRVKRFSQRLMIRARKVSFPGFDKIPLYDVLLFFYRSIVNGAITTRASAIAFSFFLALFPAIIFIFTLIPYIPIEDFQEELFLLIRDFLPTHTFLVVEETIQDILTRQRGGLLSLGFFMALIFSTNGLASMMSAFDASLHSFESRTWYGQRLVALLLLAILSVLLTIAITVITVGQFAINYLDQHGLLGSHFTYYLLSIGKWIVVVALFFFAYSSLYFFAPTKKTRWRFISAGGTLATILSIIVLVGFGYYITNFSQYNKLYGSIGTLLVVLLLFYIMSLILLIGFELNASLSAARRKASTLRREMELQELEERLDF
ncbi:YihY/virulence factor BrkB family protein [Gaoshiqia sediminis]|uniref:YihY/virulence factor BrkB family protein n=1 Tax=Gaoshiqia sediminis TaxID=2986998 RepID=A0AA41Y649_9BACT|nr:YihY/virulence factor BrkB family protein [Gaoshiqia sediminis]MCW0482634.1 YihY/virulence factor BrkB family protein [Gaoshiqia sediminis]